MNHANIVYIGIKKTFKKQLIKLICPKQLTMQENIYAPPKADLQTQNSINNQHFYVVGIHKFWILFITTIGIYQLYWFWKHYALYREATGEKLWPIPRAIFSIFFAHNLFGKISEKAEQVSSSAINLSGFATLYVVFVFISNYSDIILPKIDINEVLLNAITFGAVPVYGYALSKAQEVANFAEGDIEGGANAQLTGANIVWVLLGLLVWAMIALDLVMTLNLDLLT